jgi:hypothetical protein
MRGSSTCALFSCIRMDDQRGVAWCLKHGANPNAKRKNQYKIAKTALSMAASNNENPEIVKILLDAGADPNIPDGDGGTPLHEACDRYRTDETGIPEALIEAGANVNARGRSGNTPLHVAARDNSLHHCRLLVSKGADITIKNDSKSLPINMTDEVDTKVVIDPTVIANPVCRVCHLNGKALQKCRRMPKIQRTRIVRVPPGCAFALELTMQRDQDRHDNAKKRLEALRVLQDASKLGNTPTGATASQDVPGESAIDWDGTDERRKPVPEQPC